MAFYEVSQGKLSRVSRVSLASVQMQERRDVQALLREQLPELVPDLLVIAEEFGEWEDSKRRIDLLAIDKQANVVVVELKRGETGSHMELQAIRYAAMVSTITFDQAVEAYEAFLSRHGQGGGRDRLLEFLGWSEPNEDEFAVDVRIVLFSEDYSRELTTSILWLNDRGLDITCFRMGAYAVDQRILLDFQQIIPLKEAEDYQVKVRNKQQEVQIARRERVPWNGEFYANYGDNDYRSWEDAQKYGFISAGGGEWFSRTLRLLIPGQRVWVNRPGSGYIGVGVVESDPIPASEFMVETKDGLRRYLDVGQVHPEMKKAADDPARTDKFVKVRWLATVPESKAVKELGFFGNQNSAAKPTAASWPLTVARLKQAFKINE